ncbi:MAG: hypothetical protein PHI31_01390 [Desulfuromonadaceae bacterium]|nr:hypothetical protein [Desulfuromonadaceae bacterium]
MPSTTVRSIDSRPSIAIKGASTAADLLIDGLNVGKAEAYNGDPKTMVIEPGTHRVSIVENGNVVYEQSIFVESELKTITVR